MPEYGLAHSHQLPSLAVLAADKGLGFGSVGGAHVLGIPMDFFAGAVSDVAEVVGFGEFTTVQIKARSKNTVDRDVAHFPVITHDYRENYWFLFYSERMDMKWLMTSEEFIEEPQQAKSGKNVGKRSIWINGRRKNPLTGKSEDHCKPQFQKYIIEDFQRLETGKPL